MQLADMYAFLFEKDQWRMDAVSSILFSLCMSAFIQHAADSGQNFPERIAWAMLFGLASYSAMFVLALLLKKRLTFIRSWVWMGVGGALAQALGSWITAIPGFLEYHGRFSPPEALSARNLVSEMLPGYVLVWMVWAVLGCICILIVRFIAYSWSVRNYTGVTPPLP